MTAVVDVLTAHGWIRTTETGGYEVHPRAAQLTAGGGDSGDTVTTSSDSSVSAAQNT
ncbi:hypothetical protein B0E53_05232 [Micromonospora sp. MH33]|nr:hypothetical protein B0E53_05232 [Micromonospora sp. MH33]